jgi:formylglycine-generating enzyme required for sulfatase activity
MGEGNNPSRFTACGDDCPVDQVSWGDTQIFISRLNTMGLGTYRLPTEAEWEYAARSSSETAFANGDSERDLSFMGWWSGNSDVSYSGCYVSDTTGRCMGTHPTGQKYPNIFGLYDMHGNVYEWCQDWYADRYYYSSEPVIDPPGATSGDYHVLRGGMWMNSSRYCRSANRAGASNLQNFENGSLGFRLICDQPGE